MQVEEQRHHANVASKGKDVDGRDGFLSDVDLLVRDVVATSQSLARRTRLAHGVGGPSVFFFCETYSRDADPAW